MKGHKIRLPKKNKYQRTPEAILDVHGMYQVEAEEAVLEFMADVQDRGCRFVRIIPGKGIHSADGYGVLNTLVREILSGKGYKFSSAKMSEGGEGALDIDLTK